MGQLATSPARFAAEFNSKVPGAYRQITAEDVGDLTDVGLIGRYGYYINTDVETVRAILDYERRTELRRHRGEIKDPDGAMHCRRCGVVLANPKGKRGRPNEYCDDCDRFRGQERYRKYRSKMKGGV